MITEDQIAAATVAKIFGSELFKAQQNARTDGGSTPQFVTVDPKQFLIPKNTNQQSPASQQRMLQMLQQEAESAYPLPQEHLAPAAQTVPRAPVVDTIPETKQQATNSTQFQTETKKQSTIGNTDNIENILKEVVVQLKRIGNILENNNDSQGQ